MKKRRNDGRVGSLENTVAISTAVVVAIATATAAEITASAVAAATTTATRAITTIPTELTTVKTSYAMCAQLNCFSVKKRTILAQRQIAKQRKQN